MSEELKKKLYNYESSPPERMWDRISAALDEELTAEFPRKLKNLEIAPPENMWSVIEGALSNPAPEQFAIKLKELGVQPPASAWDKIALALDETQPIRSAPTRRIPAFIKFAAAACLVGALAFGAFKLMSPATEKSSARITLPARDSSVPPVVDKTNDASAQIQEEPKAMLASVSSSRLIKKRSPGQETGYMTQLVTPSAVDMNANYSCSFQEAALRGEVPGNCSSISDADPYLLFINPDGYLIRISKKLAETLGCIYTNARSAKLSECEDQIKKWRDKIAQSPASSSPDNFMNILDIIRSVHD